MSKYGIKEINPKNWLLSDEVLKGFVKIEPNGNNHPISGEEYLQMVLEPKFIETIPDEVQTLFDVARGAMIYGYFFYPLFTLAAEQLFRVAKAAVNNKCKELGYKKSRDLFANKIKWLESKGVVSNDDATQWDGIRKSRNIASHPER